MTFRLPNKYLCLYVVKEVTDYIEDFFRIEKGNRCRVRYCVGRRSPFYGNEFVYPDYTRFVTVKKDNIMSELSQGLSHFYMYLFNEDVLNMGYKIDKTLTKKENDSKFRKYITSQYEGVSYVIDIDSPPINPDNMKIRHDFFGKVKQFNQVTELVADLLVSSKINYNCMFSGNGFYFILESFYPDDDLSIMDYVKIMKDDLAEIDKKLAKSNNPIQIKAINQGWNRFYKLPFVIHRHLPRLSIPLSKDQCGNIDSKWLNEVTNIDNLITQNRDKYGIEKYMIEDIIKKAKWSKTW